MHGTRESRWRSRQRLASWQRCREGPTQTSPFHRMNRSHGFEWLSSCFLSLSCIFELKGRSTSRQRAEGDQAPLSHGMEGAEAETETGWMESSLIMAGLLAVIAAMFWAQAAVVEERFVPALNVICVQLNIPDSVAGATLMAAGASSPELFSSLISLFITHSSLGVGTVVGSEIFVSPSLLPVPAPVEATVELAYRTIPHPQRTRSIVASVALPLSGHLSLSLCCVVTTPHRCICGSLVCPHAPAL